MKGGVRRMPRLQCGAATSTAALLAPHLLAPLLRLAARKQLALYAKWPMDAARLSALFEEGTRRSKELKCA